MINPLWWFGSATAVLVLVRVIDSRRRHHTGAALSELARASRLNYSAIDRFDLSHRLQQLPRWTAGLEVHDVIYGASGNERRFVVTLERRPTQDDPAQLWVVSCAENLDQGNLRELAAPVAVAAGRARIEAYRDVLNSVCAKSSPSTGTPGEGRGEGLRTELEGVTP